MLINKSLLLFIDLGLQKKLVLYHRAKFGVAMGVCKRCVGQCDDKCLMNKVAYCAFCACRGHFSINCVHYKPVKHMFATPKKIFFDGEGGRTLVICKSEKALKAFLYFHKLSVCQKLEAKIKTMKKYCKENKWELNLVEPASKIL